MKQRIALWYPRLIALIFAAVFVFVTVKYLYQVKKVDGSLPQTQFSAEEGEEY